MLSLSASVQLRKCTGVDQLQHLHRLIVLERSVIDRFNPCDESNNDICSGYDIELINEQCNFSAYACCKQYHCQSLMWLGLEPPPPAAWWCCVCWLSRSIEPPESTSTVTSCIGNRAQLLIAGSIELFDCINAQNNKLYERSTSCRSVFKELEYLSIKRE